MLRFSISSWDLIKFPDFTDTTKREVRGWKEAQRQGEDWGLEWTSSHQVRLTPFKPFWGWTKNTSSSPAQGFFSPLLCLKIFPSYLLPPPPPPPYLPPPSYLLHLISHSLHSESSRAWVAQNFKETWDTRLVKDGELNVEGMWRGESKKSAYHKCKSKRRKISSLLSLHFSLCVFLLFYVWEEEDAKEKALETKGQKHEAKSENQKWEGRLRAWR